MSFPISSMSIGRKAVAQGIGWDSRIIKTVRKLLVPVNFRTADDSQTFLQFGDYRIIGIFPVQS